MTIFFFFFSPALAKCLPAGNRVRSCQSTEMKYLDERMTLPLALPCYACLKARPHPQHTSLETPAEESAHTHHTHLHTEQCFKQMPGSICVSLHWLCVCRFLVNWLHSSNINTQLISCGISGQPRSTSRLGKNAGEKARASIILVIFACLYCFQAQSYGFHFQESGAAFTTDSLQTLLWVTASWKTFSILNASLHTTQMDIIWFKMFHIAVCKLYNFSEFFLRFFKAPEVANAVHFSCCCNK